MKCRTGGDLGDHEAVVTRGQDVAMSAPTVSILRVGRDAYLDRGVVRELAARLHAWLDTGSLRLRSDDAEVALPTVAEVEGAVEPPRMVRCSCDVGEFFDGRCYSCHQAHILATMRAQVVGGRLHALDDLKPIHVAWVADQLDCAADHDETGEELHAILTRAVRRGRRASAASSKTNHVLVNDGE